MCSHMWLKTVPNHIRTEIQFIADHQTYTLELYTHQHQIHGYRWPSLLSQTAFLPTLSNYEGVLQGLWSQWITIIRMLVVPYCCQWLFQPILWIESISVTYWRHSTAVYVLMEVITYPRLSTQPIPLLSTHLHPITCHPWYYSCCKIVVQNPAVIASEHK